MSQFSWGAVYSIIAALGTAQVPNRQVTQILLTPKQPLPATTATLATTTVGVRGKKQWAVPPRCRPVRTALLDTCIDGPVVRAAPFAYEDLAIYNGQHTLKTKRSGHKLLFLSLSIVSSRYTPRPPDTFSLSPAVPRHLVRSHRTGGPSVNIPYYPFLHFYNERRY